MPGSAVRAAAGVHFSLASTASRCGALPCDGNTTGNIRHRGMSRTQPRALYALRPQRPHPFVASERAGACQLHVLSVCHQTPAGRPDTRLRGSAELTGQPVSAVGQRRGAGGGFNLVRTVRKKLLISREVFLFFYTHSSWMKKY